MSQSPPPPRDYTGRDVDKDAVRRRVWDRLTAQRWNVGPAHYGIPNFVGADAAAWRLARTDAWRRAKTVKCNPDAAQYAVRLRALYEDKVVYTPVPHLTRDFPYLRLDPRRLRDDGVTFEMAATSQGFVQHGQRIGFDGVVEGHLDVCVVGSVAVCRDGGGRTGKGAGFADLETGIFRELNVIDERSVMCTTVHSCQLVDDAADIVMRAHDSPLDVIATEQELIVTHNRKQPPAGVDWSAVRQDQFENIPFLQSLKDKMTK